VPASVLFFWDGNSNSIVWETLRVSERDEVLPITVAGKLDGADNPVHGSAFVDTAA